jgi:hypothetical protein
VGGGDDPVRLVAALLDHAVTAGEKLLGEVDLLRQQGAQLLQQGQQLGTVDDAGG